jgi:hypothetical protein
MQFDRGGLLLKATVERLLGWQAHTDGEVGKTLVTVLSNFVAEGQHRSIDASSTQSMDTTNPNRLIPHFLFREAIIECGTKRLRILSTKEESREDAVQLTEEIGCPSEFRTPEATQHLVSSGKVPTVRADRRVFLDRLDLDRWIDDNKTGWV